MHSELPTSPPLGSHIMMTSLLSVNMSGDVVNCVMSWECSDLISSRMETGAFFNIRKLKFHFQKLLCLYWWSWRLVKNLSVLLGIVHEVTPWTEFVPWNMKHCVIMTQLGQQAFPILLAYWFVLHSQEVFGIETKPLQMWSNIYCIMRV